MTVCDLLLDESLKWLFPGAKVAPVPKRPGRHAALLARYADRLGELAAPAGDTVQSAEAATTDGEPDQSA